MGESQQSDKNWSRVAALYAKSVNGNDLKGASGAACTEILKAVDETLPLSKASFIVDMGCGNGQVISRLLDSDLAAQIPNTARLVAADASQEFVDMVKARREERSSHSSLWWRLEVHKWDGTDLHNEIQDGEVSHLLGSFAYCTLSNEKAAVAEAHRVLKPGGIFVETSMGWTEWGHLTEFIKEVRSDKTIPSSKPHWQSVDGVTKTLSDAGFKSVMAKEFNVSLPVDTYQEAVDFVYEVFPFMKSIIADMSDEEVQKSRQLALDFVKQRHPEEPLRLAGKAYLGCGLK